MTIHACPPEGAAVAPCCGRTPFELPVTDRLTVDVRRVTCAGLAGDCEQDCQDQCAYPGEFTECETEGE